MKNKNLRAMALLGIAFFAMVGFSGCVTTGSKSSEDSFFNKPNVYGFKIIEPNNVKPNITLKESANIKISFNEEMVRNAGAYVGIVTDTGLNKIFVAQSPAEDIITSYGYFDGEHKRDYLLMPKDKNDPKDALAGARVYFTVSGVVNKTEQKNIKDAVEKLSEALRNKDLQVLKSLYLTKADTSSLKKQLTANTKNDKSAKESLEITASEKEYEKLEKTFTEFQKEIIEQKIQISALKFNKYGSKELWAISSAVKIVGVDALFDCNSRQIKAECVFFVSKEKAYLTRFTLTIKK